MHTLIVGARHVGKSTLINKVIRALECTVSGFETKKEDALADEIHGSPVYIYPAGQMHQQTADNLLGYCKEQHPEVLEHTFDRAVHLIAEAEAAGDMIKMDEIGFMEASSEAFCAGIMRCLDGNKPVIAAVKHNETPFLTAVKNHPNCRCFFITEENRDELFPIVLQFVRQQLDTYKISRIPAVAFQAYSGTGKTTLIEKMCLELKARGFHFGIIKHDAHRFEIDHEGKDSWRFTKAGADITIISSSEKTAVIEQRERTLQDNLRAMHDVDLILIEGYKNEQIPKIGISRKAAGKGLPGLPCEYIAVVTDEKITLADIPVFSLDDINGILNFVLKYFHLFPRKQ